MITVSDVSLHFSDRKLFDDVNIKFTPGNCYGLIGANGAGKSNFLKNIIWRNPTIYRKCFIRTDERMAVLKQNHFDFEEYPVIETVIMGHNDYTT